MFALEIKNNVRTLENFNVCALENYVLLYKPYELHYFPLLKFKICNFFVYISIWSMACD